MTPSSSHFLSLERTLAYVGDMASAMSLLGTLEQSLQADLPRIQGLLDAGDLTGANRLLHQLKGFAPVFCVDALVAQVVEVERLSKGTDLSAVREAYRLLQPQLQQLLAEVQQQLAAPGG